MKFFSNDILGKEVLSSDGKHLGYVNNIVADTKTGKVLHLLLEPSEEVDYRRYRTDSQSRIVLPFNKVKSIKDVVIMSGLD
ncbi:MAG: PRC-barrel domain-containing protein [Candidatus Thermoplasmatota archaeon]|nr:PRC-barrel domain-containing protein [Candidatus Thermoplasmatota archaeon]